MTRVLVGAFNQEKALVEAFSVITNLCVDLRFKHYWEVIRIEATGDRVVWWRVS